MCLSGGYVGNAQSACPGERNSPLEVGVFVWQAIVPAARMAKVQRRPERPPARSKTSYWLDSMWGRMASGGRLVIGLCEFSSPLGGAKRHAERHDCLARIACRTKLEPGSAQHVCLDKLKACPTEDRTRRAYFIDSSFLRIAAASLASGDNSRYLEYASLAPFVSFIFSCALPSFNHASAFPSFHKVASM